MYLLGFNNFITINLLSKHSYSPLERYSLVIDFGSNIVLYCELRKCNNLPMVMSASTSYMIYFDSLPFQTVNDSSIFHFTVFSALILYS